MLEQPAHDVTQPTIHLGDTQRKTKRTRRQDAKPSSTGAKSASLQLSVNVPRDVVEVYDQFAEDAGVIRAQLIREAIELYASLLKGGQRTYRQPGMRRAG